MNKCVSLTGRKSRLDQYTLSDLQNIAKDGLSQLAPGVDIRRIINAGGMGDIYELTDGTILKATVSMIRALDRETALGRPYSPATAGRYKALMCECTAMEKLSSCPSVIHVEKMGVFRDQINQNNAILLIKMPRLESLTHYLEEEPLTEHMLVKIGMAICQALMEGEKIQIAHRDIKPANVLVRRLSNGEVRFYLTDYGIAINTGDGEKGYGGHTKGYVHPAIDGGTILSGPEKWMYHLTDLYSLGATLYSIAVGKRYGWKDSIITDENRMSGDLARIIRKACFPELPRRGVKYLGYRGAKELYCDLEKCLRKSDRVLWEKGFLVGAKDAYIRGDDREVERWIRIGRNNGCGGCFRMDCWWSYGKTAEQHANHNSAFPDDEIKDLRERADIGDEVAEGLVGMVLRKRNKELSTRYLKRSADHGWVEGQYLYGKVLQEQGKIPEGMEYMMRAADQGHLLAMRNIAHHGYEQGYLEALRPKWLKMIQNPVWRDTFCMKSPNDTDVKRCRIEML